MKNKFLAFLVTALAAVSLAGAHAAEKPFSFTIQGTTLHIFGPDGKEIGTGLPPATIGRTVDAPPFSFQVSFGNDANGNLAVIVTSNPEHPTPLNFTVNGRSVQMDRSSVVTITMGSNGLTTIDPGTTGGVKVDNQTTVAAASPNPGAPGAMPSDATPAQQPAPGIAGTTKDDGSLTGPTPLPPQTPINTSGTAVAANNPITQASATTPF